MIPYCYPGITRRDPPDTESLYLVVGPCFGRADISSLLQDDAPADDADEAIVAELESIPPGGE